MRDITDDQPRLKRFNQEQRQQLSARLADAEARLPQEVAMAYRHIVALGPDGNGGSQATAVDLGPASGIDTITARVRPEFGGLAGVWWWEIAADLGFCVPRRRSGGDL